MSDYSYKVATSRNIGILTEDEQKKLSEIRIAVPGVGGLGGTQLMIMARLGIKNYNLADFDKYDVSNFNRQYGATVDTIGKPKIETMKKNIESVHPSSNIRLFEDGITKDNIEEFVSTADYIFDAIDLTAMEAREMLYKESRKQNKYVVACGPVGYGFFCLVFDPQGASYEDIFNIPEELPQHEKMKLFLSKITPDYVHAGYMPDEFVHPEFDGNSDPRFSWISPAIFMAAGNGVSELLKIILGKGDVITVPNTYQYDAFVNRLSVGTIA